MQQVSIGLAHWVYLVGVLAVVVTMIFRLNVVVPSIIATFCVALAWTVSPIGALGSVFNASLVAAKELFNIFLVIALMTALLNALKALGADVRMVAPFRPVMINGHVAYVVLAMVTYFISLFFWPTPAVPLVAAVLLPAAIAAGLPPMACAVAVAIAGQGMALSSDYMIGVAPGISAKAAGAGVSAAVVADRALVLSLITGLIALLLGYLAIRRTIVAPNEMLLTRWQAQAAEGTDAQKAAEMTGTTGASAVLDESKAGWSRLLATLTPLAFLALVCLMVLPKLGLPLPDLKGGDAAALIGGTAAALMMLGAYAADGSPRFFETCADHITAGFVFAFKAMGSVLPIAGFFFLGGGTETSAPILGVAAAKAPNLLFELIQAGQGWIPQNPILVAFGLLIVGMLTGIDGSGFSGLPLTGALSGALAPAVGVSAATLAAIGQMGAVWTGGGTLIAWSSLIAVTGFARVPVMECVRILVVPVLIGLAVSTVCGVLLWR